MTVIPLLALSTLWPQAVEAGPSHASAVVGVPTTKRILLNRTYLFIAGAVVAEDGSGAVYAVGGGVGNVRFNPASDLTENKLDVYDEPVASNRFRRAPVLASDAVFAAEGAVPPSSSWPRGISTLRVNGAIGAFVAAVSTYGIFLAKTQYPSKRGTDGRSSLYSRLDMDKPKVAGKPWFSSEEF
ncbi:hypothetical protein BH11ARM2_BH11ARM2_31620 [soil metagenome]